MEDEAEQCGSNLADDGGIGSSGNTHGRESQPAIDQDWVEDYVDNCSCDLRDRG